MELNNLIFHILNCLDLLNEVDIKFAELMTNRKRGEGEMTTPEPNWPAKKEVRTEYTEKSMAFDGPNKDKIITKRQVISYNRENESWNNAINECIKAWKEWINDHIR